VGEWCTAAMAYGKNNQITFSHEMNFPHSVGLLYASFTYFLGFKVNSGEYKVMGLAPFGNKHSARVEKFKQIIKSNLVQINQDGSIFLNQKYFTYTSSLKMLNEKKWKVLFGIDHRMEGQPLEQVHCDLALAIQSITEEVIIQMAKTCKSLSQSENLCLSGGLALNCVANNALREANIFVNIYVQPASGDAGGAIGAALATYYIYAKQNKIIDNSPGKIESVYLGPTYNNKYIEGIIKSYNASADLIVDDLDLCRLVSNLLAEGKIIGWFQGAMEFGPRALGNRSILADAVNANMQKKINLKIKNREGFRPFAPAVLAEYADQYFERTESSQHMMFVTKLKDQYCNELPQDFETWSMEKKLDFKKSEFPAITHTDFSARIQSVNKLENPRFWQLIEQYRQITGIPMLVNTSFNVRGEPMVCSPDEAYACFMDSGMDVLVMENYVFYKEKQMLYDHPLKWQRIFEKD
ncbi:MAG: carbamoyltransferase C-terminal domain-containing protein, partial [Bacteroidota bacterium]